QGHPVIVAISGFGGSGKTTLAEALGNALRDAAVVGVDDFIKGRLNERSEDWSSFDRSRLEKQVLEPVRRGQPARFQRYDWGRDTLGEWVTLLPPNYLIVAGIGVLHPDLMKYLDYGI